MVIIHFLRNIPVQPKREREMKREIKKDEIKKDEIKKERYFKDDSEFLKRAETRTDKEIYKMVIIHFLRNIPVQPKRERDEERDKER
jgi:hypothetical protein